MRLRHIYISHAGPDAETATRLAQHLRNAGHATRVDTLDIGLGDSVITYMNDGIADAHTVVILLSKHSTGATWQRLETESALWNELAQKGGNCLVVRLDETPVPPLLGPKAYGTLDVNDSVSLKTLVERICAVALATPAASAIVAKALRRESKNPFRHLRAEFFENRPDLLARAFASPDSVTVGALQAMKPSFLEGSRGTGKSMLLLSMRARNYLQIEGTNRSRPELFGCYLKLTRGAICNAGVIPFGDTEQLVKLGLNAVQLTDLASQELVIQTLESLVSELGYCIERGLLECPKHVEKTLCVGLDAMLFEEPRDADSLEELLDRLGETHKSLASYIRRKFIYGENPSVPVASFDLDQLRRALALVRRHIPSLVDALFVVLLDEYENLFPYQQRVINGFVKLGPPALTVKVAKKLGSGDTPETTTGQELQEIHDYSRISLVYDVDDVEERARYQELLKHILRNILASEGLPSTDVERLLPKDATPEVPEDGLKEEIVRLLKMSVEQFDSLPEATRREKWTYYREAATYRVLLRGKGRHRSKRFSGFIELAFLSSGVIRYFQEILGVAYHLTYDGNNDASSELTLPPAQQSRAAHLVSQHNLTTLSRNVERHGEELKYFLMDLGDCLRYKLLQHGSEPEAARLTIHDPESLSATRMAELRELLSVGTRESVFQTKEGLPAFKPKHSSDPQPSEFNICRIYAPVLEISPRLRWRTRVSCDELLALLIPGNRARAMQDLKAVMVTRKTGSNEKQINMLES